MASMAIVEYLTLDECFRTHPDRIGDLAHLGRTLIL